MESRNKGVGRNYAVWLVVALVCGWISPVMAETWNYSDAALDSAVKSMFKADGVTNTLNLDGTITVSGEIVFKAVNSGQITINCGATTPVVMQAVSPYSVGEEALVYTYGQASHLMFCPEANSKVLVNVLQDLYLTGSNHMPGAPIDTETTDFYGGDLGQRDLVLTFSGAGQTVFSLQSGTYLVFDALYKDGSDFVEVTSSGSGASVYIVMDDTAANVETNGVNKVIFQRNAYASASQTDPTANSVVEFALDSYMTFVSNNGSGLNVAQGGVSDAYAAVAFDVSNESSGRLELRVTGPTAASTFCDGAINLCGSFLENGHGAAGDLTNGLHYRRYINWSQVGGCVGYMRVIDDLAYANSAYKTAVEGDGMIAGQPTRRGLLVTNTCKSLSTFASDPYGDASWFYQDLFATGHKGSVPVRHGFVLGINGHIDVYHNTFFEYQAGTANQEWASSTTALSNLGLVTLASAISGAGFTDPGLVLKKHNASAFIVDGLEDTYSGPTLLTNFEAHASADVLRHAEITMYGTGRLNVRALLLGSNGTYNGLRIPATGETTGEGVYVMDIEGWVTIQSADDDYERPASPTNIFYRHDGTLADMAGTFRMPTIRRDYADREIFNTTGLLASFITRPLTVNTSYPRYDRPCLFTNASLDFYNLAYHHDDITRDVTTNPATNDAAIIGGERATFLHDVRGVTNPDLTFIRPYDSSIHLHESLCITGARLAMRERLGLGATPLSYSNTTTTYFYNHGDYLDTTRKGYGRVLMLGSSKNEVGAGGTSAYLKNAYMHVFRHRGDAAAQTQQVKFSLQTAEEFPDGTNTNEKAMQVLYLGNDSYMDFGWSTTMGIIKDKVTNGTTVYPWDRVNLLNIEESTDTQFSLNSDSLPPATFSIDGDLFYFGGKDSSGNSSPSPVTTTDMGRVIYMNYGSKIQITADTSLTPSRPYRAFSDVAIAMRTWRQGNEEDFVTDVSGLNTQIDLPRDQMHLAQPIQPYAVDLNVLTDDPAAHPLTIDAYHLFSALTGSGLGTRVRVAWDKVNPVPGLQILGSPDIQRMMELTRAIYITPNPVPMPTHGMIKMSTNDYLDQLLVSGATPANPFKLYLTGDDNGISQVRELASIKSDYLVPGEGAFAKIFMDRGARVGLGTRDWTADSLYAWNWIGKNYVSLRPNGYCQVDVNADLVVVDPQPIIPTENFGSNNHEHRITFFAHDTREIRIPSGKELDLSAFGQATGSTSPYTQQIVFEGNVRLIFEPGSALRFPNLTESQSVKYPVLYMNENSEIIFEAIKDLPDKAAWSEIADTDRARIRILGAGQIWLNKQARMRVNDGAQVSVEADATTPNTNLTISIQREAQMMVGDPNTAGGTFQVGNPTSITGAKINFVLRLGDANSYAHIGRAGFFGLGVGTIDRASSTSKNWTLQALYNLKSACLRIIKGTLNHNNVYNYSDRESSILAIGPISETGGTYSVEVGPSQGVLRGGGNLLHITTEAAAGNLYDIDTEMGIGTVNDTSDDVIALTGTAADDNGKHNITASTIQLGQVGSVPNQDAGTTIVALNSGNTGAADELLAPSGESGLQGGYRFKGNQADFFKYLGMLDFKVQTPSRYVALGKNIFEYRIGYVLSDRTNLNPTIYRTPTFALLPAGISPEGGTTQGALKGATINEYSEPAAFTIP